jgi:hypothetical protein
MNYRAKVPMILLVNNDSLRKNNLNQSHPSQPRLSLSNRELVELRNEVGSCYVDGKSHCLHFRGRRAAAACTARTGTGAGTSGNWIIIARK